MIINLNELNINKEILINDIFSFDNFNNNMIKKLENIKFDGKLYYNITDELVFAGNLIGTLILEDAVDLSDVRYKIDVKIDEIIENYEKTLDINEILWENIVLEVPIRVSNKNLDNLSGNGWKVLDEDSKEDEIDPRLEKLQEIFKGGE